MDSNGIRNLPAGVSKPDKAINAIVVFVDNCQVRYKEQIIPGNTFIERSGVLVFPFSLAEYDYLHLKKGHATEVSSFFPRFHFVNNSGMDILD